MPTQIFQQLLHIGCVEKYRGAVTLPHWVGARYNFYGLVDKKIADFS